MKTAIFLGAGASKSDGAPLQGELFQDYFMSYSFSKNQNNEMNQVLIDFFQSAFQIDVLHVDNATAFPTFEEVFGLLDLSLTRNAPFQSSGKISGKYTPQAIKRHLIILMALILKEKLCVPGYNHCFLIQNIAHDLITNNNIYFLSTNYDILMDNVLGNFDYMIDYGFAAPLNMSCRNDRTMIEVKSPKRLSVKETDFNKRCFTLFKLHGSLNWLYCKDCKSLTVTPYQKGAANYPMLADAFAYTYCNHCQAMKEPVIIPPTYFKNYNNGYLKQTWDSAAKNLEETDHIIFCGYSFPDADIHMKYLLKKAEIARKKPFRVTVINHFNGKSETLAVEEKNRFDRFFSQKVNYTHVSFEEFAREPFIFIK